VPRGNLGFARKIKLARMAAYAPLAQMFTDMDGARLIGADGSGLCVHEGKASMRISRLP
jgi:hypothetical protein